MSFLDDLRTFGPDSTHTPSSADAWRYCAGLAASHYENFSVVSRLTPKRLRKPFQSIYAFCRWSDDLGDEVGDRELSKRLLAWWRGELRELYCGEVPPRHPVMIALAETIRAGRIPIEPFLDLISAFEQDQVVQEYETYDQLLDYCRRSADPVGRLVLYASDACDAESARLADLTCTGLQLANFWQDVARDAAIGRVYLPREDRERFGVSIDAIRAGTFNGEFARLMSFEVERAREMLVAGRAILPRLPRDIEGAIDLFNRGGLAILDAIAKRDFDVLSGRPKLSKLDKARLIVQVWLGRPTALAVTPERRADAPALVPSEGGGR